MAHIDYYFATISPFTYLAGAGLEAIAEKHGASVTYKPLDIMALFARTGGVPPKDRHPNRIAYRGQELARAAKKADLPMKLQPAHFPTNMAPSSYAIIAAQNAGGGDLGKLVQSVLSACWSEDKNVADEDVIRACLRGAGFDAALADTGLLAGAETYARNLEEAVEAGVFGAPFYVLDDGTLFWGHDKLEDLDLHLSGKL